MNAILLNLFLLGGSAVAIWVAWNLLEITYRVVAIAILAVLYILLSLWELVVMKPLMLIRWIIWR